MKVNYGKVVAVYDCGKNIGEHENCIYCYVNKINGKRYVGQAKNLKRRHLEHTKKVNNRYPIDKALKKYGLDDFTFDEQNELKGTINEFFYASSVSEQIMFAKAISKSLGYASSEINK